MTIIGIDPHKSSLTAVAVNADGHPVGCRRFVVNKGTGPSLLKWAAPFTDVLFAVEGAKGLGRGIAQILLAHGQTVVDVPSTLSMKVRVLNTGGGRKSDPADAQAVALAALHHHRLHRVEPEDQNSILDLLTQQRDALKDERTRILNRLHQIFRDLIEGGVPTGLTLARARAAMKNIRPLTAVDACRRDLARDLIDALARLDAQMKKYSDRIAAALEASGTTLMQIQGIGTLLAGKILGETAGIQRFPTSNHFASYVGAAPLDSSSGENQRQRLNPGGNRQLNAVLHIIAVCQIQHGGPGRDYYLKKIDEGKTPREARRALKRRLSNVIYRTMAKDARAKKEPAS